jgi:defect in organelle trafficking protein DotB
METTDIDKLRYVTPPVFTKKEDTEKFMAWAYNTGTSDITLQSGERTMLEIHGKKIFPLDRILNNEEVKTILEHMANRPDAVSKLNQKEALNFAYAASPTRDQIYRFRINATGCDDDGNDGVSITCRTIPPIPPKLETLNVEPLIFNNMSPKLGLVLITGATGSGKTTLIASMIRFMLEDPEGHRKFLTYEDPIEFTYKLVRKPTSTIAQSEIHRHLASFKMGAIETMRRKPDVILMGEMRDSETVQETLNISLSGHTVMTTLHSNGFVDTVRRMVGMFPDGQQNSKMVDIISALRLTVGQQLLPKIGGGRIPIREIVAFDNRIVEKLLDPSVGLERLVMTSKEVLRDYGQSFTQDALKKYNQGLITKETFIKVARAAQASEEEALKMVEKKISLNHGQKNVSQESETPSKEFTNKEDMINNFLETLHKDVGNSNE